MGEVDAKRLLPDDLEDVSDRMDDPVAGCAQQGNGPGLRSVLTPNSAGWVCRPHTAGLTSQRATNPGDQPSQ